MKGKVAGSLYLVVVGLILAGIGGLFTFLLGNSYLQAKEMDTWVETPCLILESEVRERQLGPAVPVDYQFGILYGYDFDGEGYSSDDYDIRGNANVKERSKILQLTQQYPAGSLQKCWVNPEDPTRAILKKDSKAPGYSIWFPILFVVGGIGIVIKALVSLLKKSP